MHFKCNIWLYIYIYIPQGVPRPPSNFIIRFCLEICETKINIANLRLRTSFYSLKLFEVGMTGYIPYLCKTRSTARVRYPVAVLTSHFCVVRERSAGPENPQPLTVFRFGSAPARSSMRSISWFPWSAATCTGYTSARPRFWHGSRNHSTKPLKGPKDLFYHDEYRKDGTLTSGTQQR